MAFKTIKRPKISLGERFYLQSILGGLWITIKLSLIHISEPTRPY